MKHTSLIHAALLLAVLGCFMAASLPTDGSDEKNPWCWRRPSFPPADIVRHIAGPKRRVIQILPPGASPHTFDLTPGQVRELQNARIIFKIGGIDDWIDGIAESAARRGQSFPCTRISP